MMEQNSDISTSPVHAPPLLAIITSILDSQQYHHPMAHADGNSPESLWLYLLSDTNRTFNKDNTQSAYQALVVIII